MRSSILAIVAANAAIADNAQDIQNYIHSLDRNFDLSMCTDNTCCNITATESCDLESMSRDTSTVVLPGGETRCIYSYSTPFGFQVFPGDADKVLFMLQGTVLACIFAFKLIR
jgi:hypothetical protein